MQRRILKTRQTSKMELLAVNYFCKKSILDVWLGSYNASAMA